MPLAGAELSGEGVLLARESRALNVGVCVVQERFTELSLLFPQLAGGRVQLLLCFLNDKSHVITITEILPY